MTRLITRSLASVAAVLAVLAGTAAGAAWGAPGSSSTVNACVADSNGAVRIVRAGTLCLAGEHATQWNSAGVPGPAGAGVTMTEQSGWASGSSLATPALTFALTAGYTYQVSVSGDVDNNYGTSPAMELCELLRVSTSTALPVVLTNVIVDTGAGSEESITLATQIVAGAGGSVALACAGPPVEELVMNEVGMPTAPRLVYRLPA